MANGVLNFQKDYGDKSTDYLPPPFISYAAASQPAEVFVLILPGKDFFQCDELAVHFKYDRLNASECRMYVAFNAFPQTPVNGTFVSVNSLLHPQYLVMPVETQLEIRNTSGNVIHTALHIYRIIS